MASVKVLASGDAAQLLGISRQRLDKLVKQYKIPFQQTSAGRIFFLSDIEAFQKSRSSKSQYGWKKLQLLSGKKKTD